MNHVPAKPLAGNAVVPPSTDLGPRPRFEWLPIDSLAVDERYQRRITADGNTLINRIVREFNWSRFQPLTVTGPDASGDYPVIDGQHRLEACRRHPDVAEVPCWIVEAPKISDQATAFVGVNKHRISVTRINVFWAELAAHDTDAVWLKSVCDAAGVKVGKVGTGRQPPLTTVALAALLKLRSLGDATLIKALSILAKAQAEAENAFRAPTITALARLVGRCADRLDEARLIDKVADMDLDHEIDNARQAMKVIGGNTEAALQVLMVRAYNARLPEERRLPEK